MKTINLEEASHEHVAVPPVHLKPLLFLSNFVLYKVSFMAFVIASCLKSPLTLE